ncbi:MAG TPA: ABC transporter permease [Firmicutes bacterium]|nr:ABC transporter permease [Bacillota bacterium]
MKSRTANFPIWKTYRAVYGRACIKTAEYAVTFFCIISLNFFLPRLMPGDPFTFLSANSDEISVAYSEEQLAKYKAYYGLDKPLASQYVNYLGNLLRGNIGYSIYYHEPVLTIIGRRALWTIALVAASLALSCAAGIILGGISAWQRDKAADGILYYFMICFAEIPSFIIGLLLLFAGAAWLGWFPLSGGITPFAAFTSPFSKALDILHHAALPVVTLTLARLGEFYLITRGSMLSVLSKDYISTARGKGLSNRRILFGHALRNAAIPVVTRVFLSLGTVFGGAVLVENVFNYPGVGQLMRESVMLRDYVLIQGIFLFFAVSVLLMNFAADLLYKKLDPRVV